MDPVEFVNPPIGHLLNGDRVQEVEPFSALPNHRDQFRQWNLVVQGDGDDGAPRFDAHRMPFANHEGQVSSRGNLRFDGEVQVPVDAVVGPTNV